MSAAPVEPPPAPPPRHRHTILATALVTVVVVLALLVAAVYWVVATPSGAKFVLGRAASMMGEGTRLEGVEGRLGGALRIQALEIDRPDLFVHLDGVEMDTSPLDPLRGRLVVHKLHVKNVEVRTASSAAAARAPSSFTPPYAVRLEDGRIDTLRYGAITPEEKAAKDPQAKRQARAAARAEDLVLHDVVVKGEGDAVRWKIDEASVSSAYGDARIAGTLGNASPFALEVDGNFAGKVSDRAFRAVAKVKGTLKSFEAAVDGDVGGTRATAHATIEPFAQQPLRTATVQARGVNLAQVAASLPKTRLDVEARIAPAGDAFAGPVRIDNHDVGPWDRGRLPLRSAQANVRVVAGERAELAGLELALAGGGSARGSATFQDGRVEADLRVADVDLAALDAQLQKTRVTGRISASGGADAQRFEVALKDPRFAVEGRAGIAAQRLDVQSVTVRTGGGAVTAKGGMALAGSRDFRFEGRAEHFDPAAFVKTSAGDMNFTFVASGTLAGQPAGEARVEIAPSRYAGLPAAGRVYVKGDRQRLAASDVHLALGEARLDARGSFGRAGDALDLQLHAPNLSVLAKPFGVAIAGRLDAEGRLTGTFQQPAGRIALTGVNLALPSNVYVREVKLNAQAGTRPDSPIDATLAAQGVALGKETPPTPFAETLDVTLKGTRAAHRLRLAARMNREATLTTALEGGLDERAALAWKGRVQSLALTGRGAFTLAAPAPLVASAERVELGDALLTGTWGEAHFLVTRWTPKTLELRGTSPRIQIQNLARSLRLGPTPRSDLVVAGDWDIRATESFQGTVDFHRVSGDVRVGDPAVPLGLTDLVVRLDAARGRAHAIVNVVGQRVGRLRGEGNALVVRGAKGWQLAPDAPVHAHVTADVPDLATFAVWLGPDARAGGRLTADVTVSGTGAEPRLAGGARAQDLVLREPQTGFELERGEVAVRLDGRALTIERLHAVTPWHPSQGARRKLGSAADIREGTLSAEGSIDLGAGRGAIRVTAKQVPVMQVPQRFAALSGEARLEAQPKKLLAVGELKVDAGWVGALETAPPSPSEDVVVVRASASAPAQPPSKLGEPIMVDARIALGQDLYFEGRGLDTRLVGQLQVTGEPPLLRGTGTVRTEGGTYNGYGQKLTIERGVLRFSGPLDNPRLDVRAVRKGLPVEPGVEVFGSTSHLRVRLVSTPDVPEPEKLSWLVLGRGPSDLAPGDASLLLSAATSMLGKNNPGQDFAQRLGFDSVGFGRSDTNAVLGALPQSTVAGRTGTASAAEVVTVGRRLTRDVHLTYQQGLADAEGTLKVAWQITRQFQLLARAGYLPGLDAVYRWTFP